MRLIVRSLVVALAVVLAAVTACGSDEPQVTVGDVEVVTSTTVDATSRTFSLEMRFTDSSVPPQYHRSYVLTVEDQTAHVVVDSYGDVLADETVPVPDDVWASFIESLPDELASVPEPYGSDVCPGGTRSQLRVDFGDRMVTIDAPRCGDDNAATAEGIDQLMAPIYDVVDLDTLTATATATD